MNDLSTDSIHDLVTMAGDKLVTDSRKVARHFGKNHSDVMRAVRNLDCSKQFRERNFAFSYEINHLANGKRDRYYTMTKDGFMFLVMGFTGAKAAAIKEAFINAFNAMSDQLQRRDMGLWQQMQALIAQEVESKVRASFGSHLMLERKREIPHLREEHDRLETLMQPPLPFLLN